MKQTNDALNPVVKKKHRGLKIAIGTFLTAITIAGATVGASQIKNSKYSSNDEIYNLSQILDADNSYIINGKQHTLLQHNGNEPIYVYLDDSLSDEYKTFANEALEYVFKIVGSINSHYKYKIVNQNEYKKNSIKSRIIFTSNDETNYTVNNPVNGYQSYGFSLLSKVTDRNINKNSIIYLTPQEKLKGLQPVTVYTAIHELLHAFGFEDVYTVGDRKQKDEMTKTTIMCINLGDKISIITPNDLKCLISMYAEHPEDQKEIAKYKKLVEAYEKSYYKTFAKTCLDKNERFGELNYDDFKFESSSTVIDEKGNEFYYNYEITNKNDEYIFNILDKNNNVIYSTSGKSVNTNNIVILKNLALHKGLKPNSPSEEEQIIDLAVLTDNGNACIYDLSTNYDLRGQIFSIENEINV